MPIPSTKGVHRRALLREDVFATLRDAIVRGDLAPGEQLRDHELGEWLGVSRTPIREAMLRLQRLGLVSATPGRMTVVAPEDPAQVSHARAIAAELGALAVRLAADRITPEDLAEMRDANARLRAALATGDAGAAIAADDAFHAVAVRASGNPLLRAHLDDVTAVLRRTEFLHFGSGTGADSPRQHEAIIAALESGDVDLGARLTRDNWLQLSHSTAATLTAPAVPALSAPALSAAAPSAPAPSTLAPSALTKAAQTEAAQTS